LQHVCDVVERRGEVTKCHFTAVEEATVAVYAVMCFMFQPGTKWEVLCLM
jgi:hypothetical protein